jgi:hypothetical protein
MLDLAAKDLFARIESAMSRTASSKTDPRSLVGASLEIGRMLADRDGIIFRAKGKCMYPTIRAGDILRLESRMAADANVGDIAVCRRPKCLLSHRVIEKGLQGGRAYIVTRPDGAKESSDGPTFDENLLGVVVAIQRKGKSQPLAPVAYAWPMRSYFAFHFAMAEAVAQLLPRMENLLGRLQDSSSYRRMAEKCFALWHPVFRFTVRVPAPALGDAVYRELSPEDFDVRRDWRGRRVQRWTLTLNLNGTCQPAAWMTFTREDTDTWRADESFVRRRYRGAGLINELLVQAETILQRGHGARADLEGRTATRAPQRCL